MRLPEVDDPADRPLEIELWRYLPDLARSPQISPDLPRSPGRRRPPSCTSSCASSGALGFAPRRTPPPSWCSRSSATRHALLPANPLASTHTHTHRERDTDTHRHTPVSPLTYAILSYGLTPLPSPPPSPLPVPSPCSPFAPSLASPGRRRSCSRRGCSSSSPNSKVLQISKLT
jgi:hypothetical protein